MSKFLAILFIFISVNCFSQRSGTQLIRVDTLKGVDTLEFNTSELKRNKWLTAIQADFYQIADNSSNDTIYGQSSLNNIRYYDLVVEENTIIGFPNVKRPINGENGLLLYIGGLPMPYVGWRAVGVSGDTCIIKTYVHTRE